MSLTQLGQAFNVASNYPHVVLLAWAPEYRSVAVLGCVAVIFRAAGGSDSLGSFRTPLVDNEVEIRPGLGSASGDSNCGQFAAKLP